MKCFSSEVPLITRSFTLRPLLASMLFSTAWWVPCFTAHVVSLAPSTCNRWIWHTNLQLFEFALQSRNFWIRYESGIEWTLNPDIFSSGDITRWSPVLYREYCIQDGNPVPRFSLLPVEKSPCSSHFTLILDWFCHYSRRKFRALYDTCSVANIPKGVLGSRMNSITCRIRVDGQIRFEQGYVWTWKFLNPQKNICLIFSYLLEQGPSPRNITAFNSWIFISFSCSITKEYMLQTPAVWPFKSNL